MFFLCAPFLVYSFYLSFLFFRRTCRFMFLSSAKKKLFFVSFLSFSQSFVNFFLFFLVLFIVFFSFFARHYTPSIGKKNEF